MKMLRLLAGLAIVGAAMTASAQTWNFAHGGADNAGFAGIETSPIITTSKPKIVAGIGPVVSGSGPTISTNGTAYIGNAYGVVKAISRTGTLNWTATVDEARIPVSPIVGEDGSVYVIGAGSRIHDHRPGAKYQAVSTLYKFDKNGVLQWKVAMPVTHHNPKIEGGGIVNGAPVAMGSGADEAILVPVHVVTDPPSDSPRIGCTQLMVLTHKCEPIHHPAKSVLHIIGFSRNGDIVFNQEFKSGYRPDNSRWCLMDCWLGMDDPSYHPNTTIAQLPDTSRASATALAIAPGNIFVANDGIATMRGYYYQPGLAPQQRFEKKLGHNITSSSAVLTDTHSAIAITRGIIAFGGPSTEARPDVKHSQYRNPKRVYATPTRLADGRLVTLDLDGELALIDGKKAVKWDQLRGQTVASPAASKGYVYVSTVEEIVSFHADTLEEAGRYLWAGGGTSPPAIGPQGLVYAIAGEKLYIFPNNNPGSNLDGDGEACSRPGGVAGSLNAECRPGMTH